MPDEAFTDLPAAGALANADLIAITQAATGDSKTVRPQDAVPTEVLRGLPEVATDAEVTTATDDQRIVTPKKLQTRLLTSVPAVLAAWRTLKAKAGDTARTSAPTLAPDPDLVFPVLNGQTWEFFLAVYVLNANAQFSGGWQFSISSPAGAGAGQFTVDLPYEDGAQSPPGLNQIYDIDTAYDYADSTSPWLDMLMNIHGWLTADADGDISFEWAQLFTDSDAMRVKAKSFGIANRVS